MMCSYEPLGENIEFKGRVGCKKIFYSLREVIQIFRTLSYHDYMFLVKKNSDRNTLKIEPD